MKHLLNVIKDVFDPRDHVVAPNKAANSVHVDFRSKVPYIKDQGQAGSCTAHAGTSFMELLYRTQPSWLAKKVDVNTLRFSPLFVYGQERMREGTFDSDAGADSRTIFQVLASTGACLESNDLYDAKKIFISPTKEQLADASKYKIGSYHRIIDVETAKTVLVSGYTFTIGMPMYQQFEGDEAATSGKIAMPSGSSIGGHEMHVVGCDDSKEVFGEIGAFIVQNSYGFEWGDKGYCYIPYEYFNKMVSEWDAWTGHFGKPW